MLMKTKTNILSKAILLGIGLSLCTVISYAQKPKKTHDHEQFAKKVISYSLNDITKGCPDEDALQYISEKTGQDMATLKELDANNRKRLKADVDFMNENSIYRKLQETELKIISEEPIKVADIILRCEFRGDKVDIILKNCVQTNTTWVLGDAIELSGDGLQDMIDKYNARMEKPEGGLLSKINEIDQKQQAANAPANEFAYQGKMFPMQGTQAHTQFYKMDLIGQYLEGYIIDRGYFKKDVKILYEAPELMMHNNIPLKLDIDNYKSDFPKPNSVHAFYVAGQLFVFTGEYWDILLEEGAISKLGRVVKDKDGNYITTDLIQKVGLSPENTLSLALGFKNKMSKYVEDHEELAAKIKNQESGYKLRDLDKIISEYNRWYEENYPDKVRYLFKEVDKARKNSIAAANYVEEEQVAASIDDKFVGIISTWSFVSYFKDGSNQTDTYDKGFLEGNPIKITLTKDGSLFYQGGYRKIHDINHAEWKYFDEQSRNKNEPEISLVLVQYHSGGDKTIEKFSISELTENQLILENKYKGVKLVYKK